MINIRQIVEKKAILNGMAFLFQKKYNFVA